MDEETLKKWCECQNKTFTKNEFELMLKLYTWEHVKFPKDIIWKYEFLPERKVTPQDSLIAKWMVERNTSWFKLTGPWITKMEEIEKLVEKNKIQRCLYKLNQYPVAISLISTIIWTILWAIITLIWEHYSK